MPTSRPTTPKSPTTTSSPTESKFFTRTPSPPNHLQHAPIVPPDQGNTFQYYPPRPPQARPTYLTSLTRWLQLKKYQYEVTFSLYMLTATEKIVLNTIVLALGLLLVTAVVYYLPNHVRIIYNRIWYYLVGEGVGVGGLGAAEEAVERVSQATLVKTVSSVLAATASAVGAEALRSSGKGARGRNEL